MVRPSSSIRPSRLSARYLCALCLLAACASDGGASPGAGGAGGAGAAGGTGSGAAPATGGATGGGTSGFGNSGEGGFEGGGDGGVVTGDCEGGDPVDRLDLLFVVDDSSSMGEEQASLRAQFPRMVRTLAEGKRYDAAGNLVQEFTPVSDLHLGVVSTDMGLPGVGSIQGCGGLGGDGKLQHTPSAEVDNCQSAYPRFLAFGEGDDPDLLGLDFQCVATLGVDGCGIEQPLEAALKALWPSLDIDPATGQQWVDPATGQPGNRHTFVAADGQSLTASGQGDGYNDFFLRDGDTGEPSLVAVIVVSDEEDCSAPDMTHVTPDHLLMDGDPLKGQPLNLRCFLNADRLYSVQRYVSGLRALRPGNPEMVVFGAIVGVPPDLAALGDGVDMGDFDYEHDSAAREGWYDRMLRDPRMLETQDTSDGPARNLVPSCPAPSTAYPPRRIVEVARGFGPNGIVQSICQDDFSGAMDLLIARLTPRLGLVCPE